jgi:hypothetical protein
VDQIVITCAAAGKPPPSPDEALTQTNAMPPERVPNLPRTPNQKCQTTLVPFPNTPPLSCPMPAPSARRQASPAPCQHPPPHASRFPAPNHRPEDLAKAAPVGVSFPNMGFSHA